MATKKISDLTAVNLVSGSALIPIVQDGATVAVTFADLTGSIDTAVANAVTASHAVSALTASYAISASYEISYETSSSYAETATTASYAATASSAATAQLGIYNDTVTIQYIGSGFVYPDAVSVDGTTGVTTLVSATVLNGFVSKAGAEITGSVDVQGSVEATSFSGSFSGSFEGDGSGLTGISVGGSLEGAGFMGGATVDLTDPTTLKRDNLIVHESNVTINIPLASNFALGTVVEFDIFIPTGSTWTLSIDPSITSPAGGFMMQGYKGFEQVDFRPSFAPWFGPYKYFGFPGYYNGYGSSFGSLDGDYYHEGPALVRLVAVSNSFDPTSPTTPATNPMGYLWLGRIIARQPMSNSVGTGLSVETVSALPTTGNSTGDLVMFDDGLSGLKLHVYNGTGWDAV